MFTYRQHKKSWYTKKKKKDSIKGRKPSEKRVHGTLGVTTHKCDWFRYQNGRSLSTL